ncbi:unnamed protein product [Sphagnum balticum]
MEQFTMDSGAKESVMEGENKFGGMDLSTRDIGKMTLRMARGVSFIQAEMYMRENGWMIRPKVRVFTFIRMEPPILVSGTTTSSTDTVMRSGQMGHNMKVTSLRV